MSNKKVTKRDRFIQLMGLNEVAANKELVDFIKHEIELINRKNKSTTMTKTQVENVSIKENILAVLNSPMTVTEIIKALNENGYGDFSSQKVSSLMRQLVLEEKVARITDKKRTLFSKII